MAKRPIITQIEDAQFLLTCPVFVVDIETDTKPPSDEWSDKYGLSYVADITDVAFYAPGHDLVVFDVRSYPTTTIEFIRRIFNRDGYLVIGHNLIFDLRSLGGHFGFTIPRGSSVYDTLIMSSTLLLGEPEKTGEGELSLRYQAEMMGLLDSDEDDRLFYEAMKVHRKKLHKLEDALRETPSDNVLWRYSRGYPRYADDTLPGHTVDTHHYILTGSEVTDLSNFDLSGHAKDIITQYVAMDVIFPYQLWEIHQELINRLETETVELADRRIAKWSNVREITTWEQRISQVSANLAIRGVKLDTPFVEKKRRQWADEITQGTETVLGLPDTSSPYEGWFAEFQLVLWYSRVLSAVQGKGTYSDVTRWVNWGIQTRLEIDDLKSLFLFQEDASSDEEAGEWATLWAEWLTTELTPSMKRSEAFKTNPAALYGAPYPSIDLHGWVSETSDFGDIPTSEVVYLSNVKTKWLSKFYTLSSEMPATKIVNSEMWQPYHLFVVCGIELPSEEELLVNRELGTKTLWKLYKEAKERTENPRAQGIALRSGTLSLNKDAMKYYLDRFKVSLGMGVDDQLSGEESPLFTHYAKLMQSIANFNRATELLLHSSRDGRIHSLIDRGARTHRYRSSYPNLQNISMKNDKTKTFKGFLIADDRYTILELDFANAENKMGAMVSADNAFAYATESGDFHSSMADIYWPAKRAAMRAAGDVQGLKSSRNDSKPITFAIPYGAGPTKISQQARISYDEAKAIRDARAKAYPLVEVKKKQVEDNCEKRFRAGFYPAYVPLWTGNRVIVPTFRDEGGQERTFGYKTWNYLQQGGVAEMVARAKVEVIEFLEDSGFDTHILLNVHDSLLLAVKHEEWPVAPHEAIKIMCGQVPDSWAQRTIPAVHMVTEVGPENAVKWGWRDGHDYPFPLDTFINQWGEHKLPEKELKKKPEDREAPTWVGPVHEGWTLEAEMEEQRARLRKQLESEDMEAPVETRKVGQEWYDLAVLIDQAKQGSDTAVIAVLSSMGHPEVIRYYTKSGEVREAGPFAFPERMTVQQQLAAKGHVLPSYKHSINTIKQLLTQKKLLVNSNEWTAWESQYGTILSDTN